ncbi:hypothetical protein BDR05DRAFT_951400 [Suillus weaverae]|nr:hypothetical protein BDR05DRAFT_951400 [Suillus weaverae]
MLLHRMFFLDLACCLSLDWIYMDAWHELVPTHAANKGSLLLFCITWNNQWDIECSEDILDKYVQLADAIEARPLLSSDRCTFFLWLVTIAEQDFECDGRWKKRSRDGGKFGKDLPHKEEAGMVRPPPQHPNLLIIQRALPFPASPPSAAPLILFSKKDRNYFFLKEVDLIDPFFSHTNYVPIPLTGCSNPRQLKA